MKRTLLRSEKLRSDRIVVMQKLARTLRAAEKPRRLVHEPAMVSAFDRQCECATVSAEAIAAVPCVAALSDIPGRSAMTASAPSSKAIAPQNMKNPRRHCLKTIWSAPGRPRLSFQTARAHETSSCAALASLICDSCVIVIIRPPPKCRRWWRLAEATPWSVGHTPRHRKRM